MSDQAPPIEIVERTVRTLTGSAPS
jgi:hypothetical protein